MSEQETLVHLLRHGEVHNPDGVLYGRRPGYQLSERGVQMAERVADKIGHRDITHLVSSPLERAQQTAQPLAKSLGMRPVVDERIIESGNVFEGRRFAGGHNALRDPTTWRHLWNPFTPSWGEPYAEIADRMLAAVAEARDAARGHEAVLVSHQLPIWIARLKLEGRRFLHDPRRRQCTLCSLTTLHFTGDRLTQVAYSEPAGDLLPLGDRSAPFSSGGSSPAGEEP